MAEPMRKDKTPPKDVDVRWRAANTPANKAKAIVKAVTTGRKK